MKVIIEQSDKTLEVFSRDGSLKKDFVIEAAWYHKYITDTIEFKVTPEELLTFTRDLAEMQGYALVEKEPEHWVPLMEGFYVRDLLTNATLAWYPERSIAMNAASEAAEYVYDHMCNFPYFAVEIKCEDFAPLRKQYYLNNLNQ